MMVPKINIVGLGETNNKSNTTTSNAPATPIPTSTSSSSKGHGPMTPRTLFSKREGSGGSSFIIQDQEYLYILCRGCKTCSMNKYQQHYMTIKKHSNKKKKFFSF